MDNVWEIILGIVASVGGIGVVITAVVYFSSNFIAKRLQQKYDLKLKENLEKYKANLENKKYISKTKFDAEFSVYRSLSKAFFDMVKSINVMIPAGLTKVPEDEKVRKELEEKHYIEARSAVVAAQDELSSNAPFIPEKFYNECNDIKELCILQLDEFEQRWNVGYIVSQQEKEHISREAYRRTTEINEKFKNLSNELREYLEKIDILE